MKSIGIPKWKKEKKIIPVILPEQGRLGVHYCS